MPARLSKLTKSNLEKCRAAAIAAVDSYNRPGPKFRTAIYVVLIVIAWQAFFMPTSTNRNENPGTDPGHPSTREACAMRRSMANPSTGNSASA